MKYAKPSAVLTAMNGKSGQAAGALSRGFLALVLHHAGIRRSLPGGVAAEVNGPPTQVAVRERAGFVRLSISIHLSPKQFQQAGLPVIMRQVLDEPGMAAECLKLEVTESMVMRDPQLTQRILEQFHERGLAVSIADFGAGYSSLSCLRHFPIDYVKIDRSFIRDTPDDAEDIAIAAAIMARAKSLRRKVIAEGSETQAPRDLLAARTARRGPGLPVQPPAASRRHRNTGQRMGHCCSAARAANR